jgi:hypothetical protein
MMKLSGTIRKARPEPVLKPLYVGERDSPHTGHIDMTCDITQQASPNLKTGETRISQGFETHACSGRSVTHKREHE